MRAWRTSSSASPAGFTSGSWTQFSKPDRNVLAPVPRAPALDRPEPEVAERPGPLAPGAGRRRHPVRPACAARPGVLVGGVRHPVSGAPLLPGGGGDRGLPLDQAAGTGAARFLFHPAPLQSDHCILELL